jgi:hypothetical protein
MLSTILWAVVVVLVVLWILGFLIGHLGGGFIHILLVVAAIAVVWNLLTRSRSRI